jgi:diguanylate cyclase (GGDEF)-like protein
MILGIFTFIVVVAISFAVLTLAASFVRFHLLSTQLQRATPESVDPQEVFRFQIVKQLGGLHQTPEPFVILVMQPQLPEDLEEKQGAGANEACMELFTSKVRETMRKTDFVARIGAEQVGALCRIGPDRVEWVLRRVTDVLARTSIKTPSGMSLRLPLRIGVAMHPENGQRADDLLGAASAALAAASEPTASGSGLVKHAYAPGTEPPPPAGDVIEPPSAARPDLIDPVTGILRPERMHSAMRKFVARQRKDDLPVSLVLWSVDHFEKYRKHYGQSAVDTVLKGFADLLHRHTRETDLLARAGEAEFVTMMDCAPGDALVAAQRLVGMARRTPFRFGSSSLKIAVSGGVAGYPDHTGSSAEMLRLAAEAVQLARSRGQGQCALYQRAAMRMETTETALPVDRL